MKAIKMGLSKSVHKPLSEFLDDLDFAHTWSQKCPGKQQLENTG